MRNTPGLRSGLRRSLGRGLLALLLILIAMPTGTARADEVFTFIVKKQEKKAITRWSLTEWLETKERMKLMDMWLALHTPSPFEFFLGGEYQFDSLAGTSFNGTRFQLAAYASAFGLEVQREAWGDRGSRWLGLFHFRFFGYQAQGTNLTLEGGLKSEGSPRSTSSWRSPVVGLDMTLYIARYFGIEALLRRSFESTANDAGVKLPASTRWETGAFIDFSFVRVYGSYFSDAVSGPSDVTGAVAGTRIYF
jgi:hypothetical protein